MRSGIGHCVVWYEVVDVLEQHFGSVLPTSQTTQSHNLEDYNFESYYSAFSVHCSSIT
jgi:hypothetical protein